MTTESVSTGAHATAAVSLGPKIDPAWKPLISDLKNYVTYAYVAYDRTRMRTAQEALRAHGIIEDDLFPLQNINRYLIPNDMFLAYFYIESPAMLPVVKLFLIRERNVFDSFEADGKRCRSFFGEPLNGYVRVFLGDEVFSTANVPPVALPYAPSSRGSSEADWVIVIPYGWIQDLYGRHSDGLRGRIVEELTIHEIAHIVHRTRDELIPFLAQFGYKVGDQKSIRCIDDLIEYLQERRFTYHQAERLVLERIHNADAYYGGSGNTTHLGALTEIKDSLRRLSELVNKRDQKYPLNMLRMSDQQCWASMALLYREAVQRQARLENPHGVPS
jgi:hypothetical protein